MILSKEQMSNFSYFDQGKALGTTLDAGVDM